MRTQCIYSIRDQKHSLHMKKKIQLEITKNEANQLFLVQPTLA